MSWRSCLTNPLWRVPLLAGLILIIGLNAATWSKQRLERQIGPLIHNTTLPPATAQCTSCHREISEHYLETGHAKSLWRGDDPQVLSRFTNLEYEWSPEGPRYRYVVEEGKLWLTQEGSPLRLRTDWVMGSGGHSQGAVQLFTTPTGETEMLELIARGYTYEESGRALGISLSTVQTHIRNIYGKLSVNSRSAAVHTAYRLGLLHPDSPGPGL